MSLCAYDCTSKIVSKICDVPKFPIPKPALLRASALVTFHVAYRALAKSKGGNTMSRITMFTTTVLSAAVLFSNGSAALAQQPNLKTRVPMLCKISLGGPGFIRGSVLVTLSNLTTSTIPKGQTLYAKKDNKTIQFRASQSIPNGGSVSDHTSARAFQSEGDCEGWY